MTMHIVFKRDKDGYKEGWAGYVERTLARRFCDEKIAVPYKTHMENIRVAEKQVKETIFIDQLAYRENTHLTNQDVKHYLNLSKRPRMKEFIYFSSPATKIGGQEMPIGAQELKRTCLREKALNHIIYHLTKK